MLELMIDKEQIVRVLQPLVPENEISDFDYIMLTWWKNIRSTGGLGLTYYGASIFDQMGIEGYDFDIGHSSQMGNIGTALQLDKYMKCPYYFHSQNGKKCVTIYDSRIATMIMLTGNIYEYMEKIKKRQENDDD